MARTSALCVAALALAAAVPAAASAAPYSVERGAFRKTARFVATYSGSGSWRTIYHSEPPNDGGDHDTNDVDDSSTQRWDLRYAGALVVPRCAPSGPSRRDRCRSVEGRTEAAGPATVTGHVDHVHVDGLYRYDDSQQHCDVAESTPPNRPLRAALGARYLRRARAIELVEHNPVVSALELLPGQCPGQGDSLDLIDDNYFRPGFSFVDGYGPDRWFTSRRIAVPLAVLHRARTITIAVADTPAGAPPRHCAVVHPSYERCTTGGAWTGVLKLTRRP